MKSSRRNFIKTGVIVSAGLALPSCEVKVDEKKVVKKPLVVSTWNHGLKANEVAIETLQNGGSALDAVEAGVRTAEDDPETNSVGYGGLPDANGDVTLDASIMDHLGNAGSVAYIKNIKNPISVARKVMEETPHVMLAGDGAKQFALKNGFKEENLLTENSRKSWENWKKSSSNSPEENHDTIGQICLDEKGNLSGAVTTSGLAYKIPGRVGDSPIIGAALFVDNEIGAACATGMGEWMMKTLGSFLIVEKMREGFSPQEACEFAVSRVKSKNYNNEYFQAAYIAVNKYGEVGSYSLQPGFEYAVAGKNTNELIKSRSLNK
ncbi:MAG: N(4)-(beta-N-acetylglucosaminyl)-L-asparaginase [Melioribacteraceae bacterium]|nr:N(4)-(beta-N-acetylglucosaminyl)-L-asparaginase [Melioribacteraceae bacterium]